MQEKAISSTNEVQKKSLYYGAPEGTCGNSEIFISFPRNKISFPRNIFRSNEILFRGNEILFRGNEIKISEFPHVPLGAPYISDYVRNQHQQSPPRNEFTMVCKRIFGIDVLPVLSGCCYQLCTVYLGRTAVGYGIIQLVPEICSGNGLDLAGNPGG